MCTVCKYPHSLATVPLWWSRICWMHKYRRTRLTLAVISVGSEWCNMSASPLLILVVGTNMDRQTALCTHPSLQLALALHEDKTLLRQAQREPAWLGRRRHKSRLGGWWLMTCGWMGLHYWLLTPAAWTPLQRPLSSALCGSGSPLNQWNIQDLEMYHLAIHGPGCSLNHLTSLHVGWTYRRMTPAVCCSSSASYTTAQSTQSNTCSYCRLYRESCSRSGLIRGSLSEQCVVWQSHTTCESCGQSCHNPSNLSSLSVHHHMCSVIKHGPDMVTWPDHSHWTQWARGGLRVSCLMPTL